MNCNGIRNRKIYCQNEFISLVEITGEDDEDSYNDWLDSDTQKGYNYKFAKTFEEFRNKEDEARFSAIIRRNSDGCIMGTVWVSPPEFEPDLAIRIYRPYRGQGYGTLAFALATDYVLNTLGINELHAGAYQDNIVSMKMLSTCGYVPYPEGNVKSKHYLTGDDIIQFDFIIKKEAALYECEIGMGRLLL